MVPAFPAFIFVDGHGGKDNTPVPSVFKGGWCFRAATPLLKQERWTRHKERCREATFDGADGVVTHDETFRLADHPVCGAKVASPLFLNAAATPPGSGGEFPREGYVK